MWKSQINPQTNLPELVGNAKLISVNAEMKTNSNGKNYYLGVAEVELQGSMKRVTCSIYENNMKHGVEVGSRYLTTLSKGADGKVYCQMSHLEATESISADIFDALLGEEATATTTASAEVL